MSDANSSNSSTGGGIWDRRCVRLARPAALYEMLPIAMRWPNFQHAHRFQLRRPLSPRPSSPDSADGGLTLELAVPGSGPFLAIRFPAKALAAETALKPIKLATCSNLNPSHGRRLWGIRHYA